MSNHNIIDFKELRILCRSPRNFILWETVSIIEKPDTFNGKMQNMQLEQSFLYHETSFQAFLSFQNVFDNLQIICPFPNEK